MHDVTDSNDHRILYALFCLSRRTLPIDATQLGRVTGLSVTATADALLRLERDGLVDASRARLTMLGLARAVAVEGALGGHGVDLSQARLAAPPPAPAAAAAAAVSASGAGRCGQPTTGDWSTPVRPARPAAIVGPEAPKVRDERPGHRVGRALERGLL